MIECITACVQKSRLSRMVAHGKYGFDKALIVRGQARVAGYGYLQVLLLTAISLQPKMRA
jgi:hypothetical protein